MQTLRIGLLSCCLALFTLPSSFAEKISRQDVNEAKTAAKPADKDGKEGRRNKRGHRKKNKSQDEKKPETEVPAPNRKAGSTAPTEKNGTGKKPAETAEKKTEKKPVDPELERMERETDRLTTEQAHRAARINAELADLQEEMTRIEAETALRKKKLDRELLETTLNLQKLEAELNLINKTLELESARTKKAQAEELAKLKKEEARITAANALQLAKITTRLNELKLQDSLLKSEKLKLDHELAKLDLDVKRESKLDEQAALVERKKIEYLENPLQGDTLILSDRRITLNDVITYDTADYITERLHFFNNKDRKSPIFIVIDYSPGGSVMSGYRILKAMEGSEAPVHVVVKSYAASMAACITTLAEKSYAYPNAIILHHQMSYLMYGNMTEHKEQMEKSMEYWRRLARPVAAKMGMELDALVKKMYEESSEGDWSEFADEAVKLKWVDHIVKEIRETATRRNPDNKKPSPATGYHGADSGPATSRSAHLPGDVKIIEEKGRPHLQLPRLKPFDAWFLHNRDGYYKY